MAERKSIRRGLFPMLLGVVLLVIGLIGAHGEDTLLQYAVRAPMIQSVSEENKGKVSPNQPLAELTEKLEGVWEELADVSTLKSLCGSATGVSMAADGGETVQATLNAVRGDYFALYPRLLLSGRLLQPEELKFGAKVIVLDEDLAIKLFSVSDPVDRYVKLGDESYRVAGIVRHRRSVGEAEEYGAYVPLSQIEKGSVQMDMLTVTARPVPKSGALSAFTAAMGNWQAGGSVYDLDKEAMRAGMLGRLVLCGAGLYLVLTLFRLLGRTTAARVSRFSWELRTEYLRILLPGLIRDGVLLLLGYAATLAGCAGLTLFALQPVYVFPEWIPAVLVEWNDIHSTFWNLTGAAAQAVQYLTPEMARIRFFSIITHWGLVWLLFGGLSAAVARIRKPD